MREYPPDMAVGSDRRLAGHLRSRRTGDLYAATDLAQRMTNVRFCRIEDVRSTHVHAPASMIIRHWVTRRRYLGEGCYLLPCRQARSPNPASIEAQIRVWRSRRGSAAVFGRANAASTRRTASLRL